jgi:monoamine oxidase
LPAIPGKLSAFKSLGFGAVIKFLLSFKEAFWEEDACKLLKGRCMPQLGFLFSEETIPTWWTQLPEKAPILTGWMAGPQAEAHKATSNDILLHQALDALASLFRLSKATIQDQLVSVKVINWAADPFARGAYAYATVETKQVRNTISQPEMDTLFFAGEALYDGPWIGTVEAALESGRTVAKQML